MVDDERTDDDGPLLYYKLTNEPEGSGELKMMKKQLYTSDSSTFCQCTEEIPPTVLYGKVSVMDYIVRHCCQKSCHKIL